MSFAYMRSYIQFRLYKTIAHACNMIIDTFSFNRTADAEDPKLIQEYYVYTNNSYFNSLTKNFLHQNII